jgi:hypothetical protein
VQSAAKNEMAFQQRAGIAEDLQHLVFGHGLSFTFHVSRFKSLSHGSVQVRREFRFRAVWTA